MNVLSDGFHRSFESSDVIALTHPHKNHREGCSVDTRTLWGASLFRWLLLELPEDITGTRLLGTASEGGVVRQRPLSRAVLAAQ